MPFPCRSIENTPTNWVQQRDRPEHVTLQLVSSRHHHIQTIYNLTIFISATTRNPFNVPKKNLEKFEFDFEFEFEFLNSFLKFLYFVISNFNFLKALNFSVCHFCKRGAGTLTNSSHSLKMVLKVSPFSAEHASMNLLSNRIEQRVNFPNVKLQATPHRSLHH